MSTTAYWEQVRPLEPLGSSSTVKHLLWPDGDALIGTETVIERGDRTETFLRGWLAGRGRADDDDAAGLVAEFLEHLVRHKALRVWVDE